MKTVIFLIKRNTKLFFKDKGMFFTALITPAILLVLYGTFLGNVYRDSFTASLPAASKTSFPPGKRSPMAATSALTWAF